MADWIKTYVDAWNSHDGERVVKLMASDITFEDVAAGQRHEGSEAMKSFVAEMHQWTSDVVMETTSMQQSGDRYAFEWELRGTNTGAAGGLPATGKQFLIRGVSIGELDSEGRIAHNRDYWNMADYLAQVGIMPGTGPE
jgi:steroid delta-isomerase-like uncharacterized protein